MSKKYLHIRIVFVFVLIISVIVMTIKPITVFDAMPFYVEKFDDKEQAIKRVQSKDLSSNEVEKINSNISVIYVQDTGYTVNKDYYYSGQGLYIVDNKSKQVIYCLDPTLAIGRNVSYDTIIDSNLHAFNQLDSLAQEEIMMISSVSNELYKNTLDVKYLAAGQMLIWDRAGFELEYYHGVQMYIKDIKSNMDSNYDQLLNQAYKDSNEFILVDTNGQDLIKPVNSPVINNNNKDEIVDTNPMITGNYYVHQTKINEDGNTDLIDLSSLKLEDFMIDASDEQDGNLINSVQVDYTAVDTKNTGIYPVIFSTIDSDGNVAEIELQLVIADDSYQIDEKNMIVMTASDISLETVLDNSFDGYQDQYQKDANVNAYSLITGKKLDVKSEMIDITSLAPNDEMSTSIMVEDIIYPSVIEVTNSVDNTSMSNYIFAIGEGQILEEKPYIVANDIVLNIGDEYLDSMLNAVAFDGQSFEFLTNNIIIDSSSVDTSSVGSYPVSLSVIDEDANISKTSVNVVVIDEDTVIDDTESIAIEGRSFVVSLSKFLEAKNKSKLDDLVMKKADVMAFSLETSDPVDISIDLSSIQDVDHSGIYNVIINATLGDIKFSKTIDVVIVDDSQTDLVVMGANDVFINKGEKYDPKMHDFFAYDSVNSRILSNTSVDYTSVNINKEGVYNVIFSVDTLIGTYSYQSSVIVSGENSIMDNEYFLTGNNIYTDIASMDMILDLDEFIVKNANVNGYNISDASIANVDIDSSMVNNEPGAYQVMLSIGNISKEIDFVITDGNTVDNEMPYLYAKDISINLGQLYDVKMHKAFGYDKKDGIITPEVISYNTFDKSGVYDVTYTLTDSDANVVTKIVHVIVSDLDSQVNDEVFLDADDFVVQLSDIDNSNINQLVLDNANVIAKDIKTNSNINVSCDTSNVYIPGVYEVKINAGSLQKIINMVVIADNEVVDSNDPYLYAVDTSIDSSVMKKDYDYMLYNNLFAYDYEDKVLSDKVVIDLSDVKFGVQGTYDIVFSIVDSDGNDTSITKKITIYDEIIELTSNDVIINVGDIYDVSSHNASAIDVDLADISDKIYLKNLASVDTSKSGIYNSVLCVDSISNLGYSKCVNNNVIVLKQGEIIDNDMPYLSAENAVINIFDEYDENIHNSFSYDYKDGIIDVDIDSSLVDNTKTGVYPVVFNATDSDGNVSSITRSVLVSDNSVYNDSVFIDANDVVINFSDLEGYTNLEQELISLSMVRGYEVLNGQSLAVNADISEIVFKKGIYNVKYDVVSSITGQSITIDKNVVVVDDKNNVGDQGYIYSDDLVINIGEDYDNSMLNYFGYDTSDGNISDLISISGFVNPNKVGVYPVVFDVIDSDGNHFSTTSYVTVLSTNSAIGHNKMLDASDVIMPFSEYRNLDKNQVEEKILLQSNSIAYNMVDGSSINTSVNIGYTIEKPGIYNIDIMAGYDLSKSINLVLLDDQEIIDSQMPYISSNNVDLSVGDVYDVSMHNLFGYDIKDGDVTDLISIDYSDVNTSVSGIYSVYFEVSDSDGNISSMMSSVSVIGRDTVINENIFIKAQDIYTDVPTIMSVASNLETYVSLNSQAHAYDRSTNQEIIIDYDLNNLLGVSTPGVYEVILNANQLSMSIDVVVLGDGDYVDDQLPYIYANDTQVNRNDIISYDKFLDHNVFAYDKKDGTISDINVDDSMVDYTKNGIYDVVFTAVDSDMNHVSKTVKVILSDGSISLSANDVIINKNQAYDVTSISEHNVIAKDYDGSDISSSARVVNYDAVDESKLGIYQVDIEVSGLYNTKVITQNVIVIDGNFDSTTSSPYLYAQNIVLNVGDNYMPSLFGAYSYDNKDKDLSSIITYDDSLVDTSKPGVYPVDITVVDSDLNSMNIKKTVVVKSQNTLIDNQLFIDAKSFTMYQSELSDNNNVIVDQRSGINARNIIDGTNITYTSDLTSLNSASKPGVYKISYTASLQNISKSIYLDVVVLEDNAVLDNEAAYIYGEDIILNEGDVYNNSLLNSFAYDKKDKKLNIVYDDSLVDTSKFGKYPVKLSTIDSDANYVELTKYVYVINNDSILSSDNQVILNAHDVSFELSTFKDSVLQKSVVDLISTNAGVLAYDLGLNDPAITYDLSSLENVNKPGVYDVEITATASSVVSKVIKVVILDDGSIVDDEIPYIYSENLMLNVGDSYDVSMHNAFGYDKQDGEMVDINISHNVDTNKIGVYPVQFSVTDSDGNTKVVTSTVVVRADGVVFDNDNKLMLVANSFVTDVSTISNIVDYDSFVKEKGNINGYDISNGNIINPTIEDSSLLNVSKPGVYPVEIVLTDPQAIYQVSKIINVVVVADGDVLDNTTPYIYGVDAQIGLNSRDTYISSYMSLHKVFGYDLGDDSNIINFSIDDSEVNYSKNGIYDVVISGYDSKNNVSSMTKKLMVSDNSINVSAEDVIIKQAEVYNSDSISLHNVVATDYDGSDISSSAVIIDDFMVDENTPGIYQIEIKVTGKSADKIITQNVVVTGLSDSIGNEPYIYAENKTYQLGDTYLDSDLNVFSYDKQDKIISNVVIDSSNVNTSKAGVYTVKISASDSDGNRSLKKVLITVTSNTSVMSNDSKVLLDGNDFVMQLDEITHDNSELILNRSSSIGYELDSGDGISIDIDQVQLIDATKPGIYPITISATHSNNSSIAIKTINVLVVDNILDVDNNVPYLYSKPVFIKQNETYNNSLHTAFSYDIQDGPISNINYDTSVIDTSIVSNHDINISVEDSNNNSVSMLSKVVVYDKDAKISNNNLLSASNFTIELSKLHALIATSSLDNSIINDANVYSYNMNTGESLIDHVVVDSSSLLNVTTDGVYSVDLSLNIPNSINVIKKTISIAVINDGEIIDSQKPYIGADNITINKNQPYNNSMLNSFGYDLKDGKLSSSLTYSGVVDTSKVGVYPINISLIDSDKNSIDKVAYVTVTDENSVISDDNKVLLSASNIYTDEADIDMGNLNNYIISKGNISAVEIDSGNTIIPTFDISHVKSSPFVYKIDIYATHSNGSSYAMKTIDLVVTRAGEVVDDNIPYLFAEDSFSTQVDYLTYNAKKGHNVYAYDKKDGIITSNVNVDNSLVNGTTNGKYDVEFEVTDSDNYSTNKIVSLLISDKTISLTANNIAINIGENYNVSMHGAIAKDIDGSDISNNVEIVNSLVDVNTAGIYPVELSVTNSNQDVKSIFVSVAVLEKNEIMDNDKPYIHANNLTAYKGHSFTNDLLDLFAYDLKDGDVTSNLVIDSSNVDINKAGIYDVYLSATDSEGNISSKTVTVQILENFELFGSNGYVNETQINNNLASLDTYIINSLNASSHEVSSNTNYQVVVTNKTSLINAKVLNNGVIPYGVYPITISSTNNIETLSKTVDLVVLPKDHIMPTDGTPYVYATDITTTRGSNYTSSMHKVFAYDKEDGLLYNGMYSNSSNVTYSASVNTLVGDDYPVLFSVTDSSSKVGKYTAHTIVTLPEAKFNYKINALNLDFNYVAQLTNYSSTPFNYKLIVKEGNVLGQGNQVFSQQVSKTSVGTEVYSVLGNVAGLKADTTYNFGLYEAGVNGYYPTREYFLNGSVVTTPKIDPGMDNKIYSNDSNLDGKSDSLDNYSYIKDIYDLESIGYEADPQPTRIAYVSNASNIFQNDLTVVKYGHLYRPFTGNYRLLNDIDANVTNTDIRSDNLGGFGSDGFKPIGFKFNNNIAQGGSGFGSVYSLGFSGKFDGGGYTISNLKIDRGTETGNYIGMFGLVTDNLSTMPISPNLYDIKLADINLNAPRYTNVGPLVGYNQGYLKNVEVRGNVSGGSSGYSAWVGGIVGYNGAFGNDALLEYARFEGNVDNNYPVPGDQNVSGAGGIAGRNYSDIRYSSNSGTVESDDNAGGLVGLNNSNIYNSFSSADILLGSNSAGGIIGYGQGVNDVYNTYSTGNIYHKSPSYGQDASYVGGIAGWTDYNIRNSFSTSKVRGEYYVGGIAGVGTYYTNNIALNNSVIQTWSSPYLIGRTTGNSAGTNNIYYNNLVAKYNLSTNVTNPIDTSATSVSNAQLKTQAYWISKGYTTTNWDFSQLTNASIPLLKGANGEVLNYQTNVALPSY